MKDKLTPTVNKQRITLQEEIPLLTPLVVYVEPSGYCNLKCRFCPHGIDEGSLKNDLMPLALFTKIIDDLTEFPQKIKLLRFCGNGEPSMNKDIVSMLQYAKECNVTERMELVTNGILLTADLIRDLPRFLDRIIISVNGLCADEYRITCQAEVNFNKLLDNIQALYASKAKCVIHIKIFNELVTLENKKKAFFDMFSQYCDEIYIENMVPMWPQLDTGISANGFRWGGNFIKHEICAQIFKGLQVQADGEVVPCCVDWKRVNALGDINKISFFDIWHGEKLKKLQVDHLMGNKIKTQPCKDCSMNDFCEIDNIDMYADECMQRLRSANYTI